MLKLLAAIIGTVNLFGIMYIADGHKHEWWIFPFIVTSIGWTVALCFFLIDRKPKR